MPEKAFKNYGDICRMAGLVHAYELFAILMPSHPASIETQKTEFILREEAGGYRRLKGRAATAASKITFLEMYAQFGVDLTRRIPHQADLQV